MNKKEILDIFVEKTRRLLQKYNGEFVEPASFNNKYFKMTDLKWTHGFLTGMSLWPYVITNDIFFKNMAFKQIADLKHRLVTNPKDFDHDLGFLFSLSANATYKLFNLNKDVVIRAADALIYRFVENAKVIKAWGKMDDGKDVLIIIDTFMNLPLLYQASLITGDDKYKKIALAHLDTAISTLIREDYTTYHCYLFDYNTGKRIKGKTHQGKSDESMWSRGQAWGIYGLMLSYRYNKERKDLVHKAEKLLDVFVNNLPDDFIAPWDFSYSDTSRVLKDSSASVIAMLGILEMLNCDIVTTNNKNKYQRILNKMLDALISGDYISPLSATDEDGLLRHTVYGYPRAAGVNEFSMWGDYFVFELFIKLNKVVSYDFW